MKTKIYFLLFGLIVSNFLFCTPQGIEADSVKYKADIYGTGDDQAIYPDNERD